jgi:hypothetical protein
MSKTVRTESFRYAVGVLGPERLPIPESSTPWKFSRVVAILGRDDLLISLHNGRGAEVDHVRTSGRPAQWNARYLTLAAPGLLLGQPGFTPRRGSCFTLLKVETSRPRWTRCYRWEKRAADGPYSTSMTPDGRWVIGNIFDDVVLIDGRTGNVERRIRFDDKTEAVRFEDNDHFLVVLVHEFPDDSWPLNWIVRCSLDLRCERATPVIEIIGYDTLDFVPSMR